jgi:DNA-binding NarL/FixJ family response regulator
MKKYKIAIADDHQLFSDGIAEYLEKISDVQMIFTANSTAQLLKSLRLHAVDILLLDLNIPPDNGLMMIPPLRDQYPTMKILILSMYQPLDVDQDIATLNTDAYVLKTSGKEVLYNAIQALKDNKKYIDPHINVREKIEDIFTISQMLTKREKEIVKLVAQGKSNKEIAAALFLSELTIKTHRKNIKVKLGVKGKADFIYKSIKLFR